MSAITINFEFSNFQLCFSHSLLWKYVYSQFHYNPFAVRSRVARLTHCGLRMTSWVLARLLTRDVSQQHEELSIDQFSHFVVAFVALLLSLTCIIINIEHCQAHRAQRRMRNVVRVFILDNKMQESRLELVFFKTAAQLTVETNEHKLKWKMQVNSLPIQPKQKQLAFATHYYTVGQWV